MNDKFNKVKDEMSEVQRELEKGMNAMLDEIGNKLSAEEKAVIVKEVAEIKELIDRLKTGLIWIALFGKTCVGKSAVANSLIGENIAGVSILHDFTTEGKAYKKEPWMIVDVPGIMGEKVNEEIALEEARKAHAHIFVVDEEPFEKEIELFDLVSQHLPDAPRFVLFNKFDRFQHMPTKNKEIVISKVKQKMKKYVKSADDIVFGSAELYDALTDKMIRQRLPQLEDKLYSDAGTLGQIVNVLDPAKQAENLSSNIREKILEIRRRVARKVIHGIAFSQIATALVPFNSLIITPGLLATLTYSLLKIMGVKKEASTTTLTGKVLVVCSQFLAADFAAVTLLDLATDILGFGIFGMLVDVAGLSYFKYKRTLIFGEAMLQYIENDFSFGADPKSTIKKAKELAAEKYVLYKGSK